MGSSNVAELRARLVADTSQFVRALKTASGALKGVAGGFGGLFKVALAPLKLLGGLLKGLGGGLIKIGQIAAGIILARVFELGVQAAVSFVKKALAVTEVMQRLGLQIQTLAAREMQRNINASIDQAITWRKVTASGETLVLNVAKLKESFGDLTEEIVALNPELIEVLTTSKKHITVATDLKNKWLATSDVFDAAGPKARGLINELKKIGIISPFTIATTNTMFRLSTALGFTSKQGLKITKGMLDLAAGLGLTDEQSQRLVLNFAQIRSQGKLTQRDIREMSLTGFQMTDMFEEMNRQLGTNIKTNTDFNAALKAGQFSWEEFVTSFADMSEREFGESAKRMAVTIGGIKSTFEDVFLVTIPEILGPTAELFGEFALDAINSLVSIVESGDLEEMGQNLRTKVQGWITKIEDLRFAFSVVKNYLDNNDIFGALTSLALSGVLPEDFSFKVLEVRDWLEEAKINADKIVSFLDQVRNPVTSIFKDDEDKSRDRNELWVFENNATDLSDLDLAIKQITVFWQDHGAELLAGLATLWEIADSLATTVKDSLGPAFEEFGDFIKKVMTDDDFEGLRQVLGFIAIVMSLMFVPAIMMATATITVMLGMIERFLTSLNNMATGVMTFVKSAAEAAFLLTQGDFKGALDAAGDSVGGLGQAMEGVGQFFTQPVSGVVEGFREIGNLVGDMNKNLLDFDPDNNPILNFMDKQIVPEAPLIDISESIDVMDFELVEELLSTGMQETVEALAPVSHDSGHEIMGEFMDGWVSGVRDGRDPVIAEIRRVAAEAAAAAKLELGIESPSKVMFDIGQQTTKGFAKGITSGAGEAVMAMSQTAKGVIGAISGAGAQSGTVLAQSQDNGVSRQVSEEQLTRAALITKFDELIFAIRSMGDADQRANAFIEGLQTADL